MATVGWPTPGGRTRRDGRWRTSFTRCCSVSLCVSKWKRHCRSWGEPWRWVSREDAKAQRFGNAMPFASFAPSRATPSRQRGHPPAKRYASGSFDPCSSVGQWKRHCPLRGDPRRCGSEDPADGRGQIVTIRCTGGRGDVLENGTLISAAPVIGVVELSQEARCFLVLRSLG
jgi:hypothetical protein